MEELHMFASVGTPSARIGWKKEDLSVRLGLERLFRVFDRRGRFVEIVLSFPVEYEDPAWDALAKHMMGTRSQVLRRTEIDGFLSIRIRRLPLSVSADISICSSNSLSQTPRNAIGFTILCRSVTSLRTKWAH
jgi:hypothetical protein